MDKPQKVFQLNPPNQKRFTNATAKHVGYNSANNVTNFTSNDQLIINGFHDLITGATPNQEQIQALTKAHKTSSNSMAKLAISLKELTTAVKQQQETIKALAAKIGVKEPVTSNPGSINNKGLHKWMNCKQMVKHKDENCLELETNAHKCWEGWTCRL